MGPTCRRETAWDGVGPVPCLRGGWGVAPRPLLLDAPSAVIFPGLTVQQDLPPLLLFLWI